MNVRCVTKKCDWYAQNTMTNTGNVLVADGVNFMVKTEEQIQKQIEVTYSPAFMRGLLDLSKKKAFLVS